MVEVRAVSTRLSDLGEGPCWDFETQKLYYVDAFVGDVCRLDPQTGYSEVVSTGELATFVIPYKSNHNQLLISQRKDVCQLDFGTGTTKHLTTVEPNTDGRFNDGKCDGKGRLWTGTVHNPLGNGHLYKMDSNYEFVPYASDIVLSNGLAWSPHHNIMYYNDSEGKKIYAFDFDLEDGSASNQRILFDFNDPQFENLGVPDGMTSDIHGKLYVGCYGGSCVLVLDPTTKTIQKKIDIPARKATSCAFGGYHYDILYVTTGTADTPEEKVKTPLAGAVFSVTGLETYGQAPNKYEEPSI